MRARHATAVPAAIGATLLAGAGVVLAYFTFTSSATHNAEAVAGAVGAGQQPALASVSGRDVTITWSAATNAATYSVARANVSPQNLSTVEHGSCGSAVAGVQCTDTGVPVNGSTATNWTYSDTPQLDSWTGATSAASTTVSVPAPALSLAASSFSSDGGSTNATVSNFFDGESVTYCLDQSTTPCTGKQLGTATVPSSGGTVTSSISTPAGTVAGAHTVYAVGALGSLASSSITITPGAATHLVFTTQPGGGQSSGVWTSQPVVTVEDGGGNTVTSSSASVTLAINTQPGSGATLSCTSNPKGAGSGVATFAGCKITGSAGSYTLSAASAPLTSATSGSVSITAGTATQVVFTTEPGGGANGAAWNVQPSVTVEDSAGNTVTGDSSTVSLAINTQPGSGATLSCTGGTSKAASAGVATFAGCQIVGSAGSYTLKATDGSLTPAISTSFSITVGASSKLVFSAQPGGGANGAAWSAQPAVSVEDSGGNVVTTDSSSVTLAINTQPGSGASLSCTGGLGKAAASGVATFAGCTIVGKSGAYTLSASDGTLTSVVSNSFSITVGSAAQLAFTTQPGGGGSGASWSTQPSVSVEDSGGNVVTTDSSTVTLAIASQPGTGATLSCTGGLGKPASSGVATYAGCQITGAAGSYTLSASDGTLSSATSSSFSITFGAASKLVFSTQPGNESSGALSTQPVVSVEDSAGNVVTTSAASVALAIGTNPNPGSVVQCSDGSVTLHASPSMSASSGVATYTGCGITKTGNGYTLTATSAGLTTATSSAFNVTAISVPTITFPTSSSQETVTHGNSATFTVTGTGFANGAVVSVSGGFTVNSVTWVSSTQLSVNVTAGNGSSKGTYSLTVTNPDGGAATSANSMVNS